MEGATVEELLAYIFGIYIKFSKKIHFELNSMEFGLSCNIAWVTSEQFVIIETPIIMHFYFSGLLPSNKGSEYYCHGSYQGIVLLIWNITQLVSKYNA